jgi:hypothetical protein
MMAAANDMMMLFNVNHLAVDSVFFLICDVHQDDHLSTLAETSNSRQIIGQEIASEETFMH